MKKKEKKVLKQIIEMETEKNKITKKWKKERKKKSVNMADAKRQREKRKFE